MRFDTKGNVIVFELQENIIHANSNAVKEEMKAHIRPVETPNVLVDLAKTQILDSSGLGVFISILTMIKQKNGRLKLCGASPFITKIAMMKIKFESVLIAEGGIINESNKCGFYGDSTCRVWTGV